MAPGTSRYRVLIGWIEEAAWGDRFRLDFGVRLINGGAYRAWNDLPVQSKNRDGVWTRLAGDRMEPGYLGAPAGLIGAGRSIAPNFVEDVIMTGDTTIAVVNGVTRTTHTSGTVQVVTEQGGRIVVTVNSFSGG